MTTKTTGARKPGPKPRRFGEADPGMFAPMTSGQIGLVRALVNAGWFMTEAAHGCSELWFETAELLHDMHLAWEKALRAERRAVA